MRPTSPIHAAGLLLTIAWALGCSASGVPSAPAVDNPGRPDAAPPGVPSDSASGEDSSSPLEATAPSGVDAQPQNDAALETDSAPGSDAGAAAANDAAAATDGNLPPLDYGGVGQLVPVPLQYTATPVPPIVAPECPGDPTQGFTEYKDTFVVQRPYDLAAADRFSYENGIYTFWIMPGDKPHTTTSATAPRTEARYSDMRTGIHIWSGDVMFEANMTHTALFQIHSTSAGEAVYLQAIGGGLGEGAGPNFMTNYYGKWFNLKVVFDAAALSSKVYVNNCLKISPTTGRDTGIWYFKHGVYGCAAPLCKDHYKNIHLYQMGSTDTYGVVSPFP